MFVLIQGTWTSIFYNTCLFLASIALRVEETSLNPKTLCWSSLTQWPDRRIYPRIHPAFCKTVTSLSFFFIPLDTTDVDSLSKSEGPIRKSKGASSNWGGGIDKHSRDAPALLYHGFHSINSKVPDFFRTLLFCPACTALYRGLALVEGCMFDKKSAQAWYVLNFEFSGCL